MSDIKIIQTKYGRGVTATKNFKSGDIITISEGIPLKDSQMPDASHHSPLWAYVFQGLEKDSEILVLDWTSLMNHSATPNVTYKAISPTKVKFIAQKDIHPGDELNIDYGYNIEDHSTKWGINEKQLLADTNLSPSQGGVELKSISFDKLSTLKTELTDAPSDVKSAFNQICKYLIK